METLQVLPGIPHIKLPGPRHLTVFDEASIVLTMKGVNLPISLTKPSGGVVNWCPMGSGGGFHYVCTPSELLLARTSLSVASHPL